MTIAINETLKSLCARLSSMGSQNYVAAIQLYHRQGPVGRNVVDTVSAALGRAVVLWSSTSVDRAGVLAALKEGLEYAGDDGAHPNRAFLTSEQFKKDEEAVLKLFDNFIADAGQLISFSLKEGHPLYPVFWDFAFVIEKGSDAFVLIGSSSD